MPWSFFAEQTKDGAKKLSTEYRGERLKILRYDAPADFSKFLDAIKKGDVTVSYLGYGAGHITTEHKCPKGDMLEYSILENFLQKRTNEFFKMGGNIKIAVDNIPKAEDFYIEAETSNFSPHNLRLYAKPEVTKQLELLLK